MSNLARKLSRKYIKINAWIPDENETNHVYCSYWTRMFLPRFLILKV